MIKNFMETNCLDVSDELVIVGTCLKNMQPKAYEQLTKDYVNVYELCLEVTHINMAISKLLGMVTRNKIKKIIFASVDKSPHCVGMHYIEKELSKGIDLSNVEILHYVAVDNKLISISKDTISRSKNLSYLEFTNK